jgi:MFS family permease
VLGVIDILLFLKVDEPPVTRLPTSSVREILAGPFGHPEFRSFIGFTCFWHVAAMIGAPFISLYLLQYVGMQLFQVLLLWTGAWAGGAISSRWLGRMAERHGNRPVLILCTALKSVNMVALLLVPREPWLSFWLLLPVFMVDMALNTGITIANNGYMIKNSPVANRTMYIAAGTAIAGLCGGVASIVSGQVLTGISDWPIAPGWWNFTGFHVLFGVSLMMRLAAVLLVRRVRERDALPTTKVVKLLIGINPIRFLRYRAGPYEWRWRSESVVLSEKWAETGARAGDRAQPAQAGGEDGLSQIEVATADNSMIDTESQEGTSEDIPPSLLIRVRSA